MRPVEAVKDVIKMHCAAARLTKIKLIFDESREDSENPLIEVQTDAERVMQVFQNVLRQAISLAVHRSKIRVQCSV